MNKKKKQVTKVVRTARKAKCSKEEASLQAVGALRAAGWTHLKISKQLNISLMSAKRWAKEYQLLNKDSKTSLQKDETAERIERLTKMSWKAIEEGLKSKRPYGADAKLFPDNVVRTTVGMKYLSTVGEFIEKKEIDANINIGDMSPDELAEFIIKNI